MEKQTFYALLDRYLDGRATDPEKKLVEAQYERLSDPAAELTAADRELLAKVQQSLSELTGQPKQRQTRVVPFYRRWVAAAAVLVLMAGLGYLLLREKPQAEKMVARVIDVKAPDKNRALITLGNGKTIYLDSVAIGKTIEADGVQLTKLADGRIVYSGDANTIVYNTASNPRGSMVMDLELNDHSHVWLNAGSSITYPVAFSGNTRNVSITGEAYFEVAHDANKPFIVSKGSTSVQVLGTHFNVKAYDNEPSLKVTLLEGAVRVTQNAERLMLKPGEQAIVDNSGIELAAEPNLDDVIAWKNGFTSFHGVNMQMILRELERWYDITTEMKKEVPANRVIDVPRNVPLKDMLKTLLDDNGIAYAYDAASKKLTIL